MTDLQPTASNKKPLPPATATPAKVSSEGQEMWNKAVTLANSDVIPDSFRGKPNSVFLAIDAAMRMNTGVLEVMQNLYVVSGQPSFSTKYKIALVNRSGKYRGGLNVEMVDGSTGPGSVSRCWAIDESTGMEREEFFTWAEAEAEGLISKKGSKYRTTPDLMMKYRAASRFISFNCPELTLGMPSREELEGMRYAEATVIPQEDATQSLAALAAAPEESPAPVEVAAEPEAAEAPTQEQGDIDRFTFEAEQA